MSTHRGPTSQPRRLGRAWKTIDRNVLSRLRLPTKRFSPRVLWLLPLLLAIFHLIPVRAIQAPWDLWHRLWGVAAWPLAVIMAPLALFPRDARRWDDVDPRFLAGLEVAAWATLGLIAILQGDISSAPGETPGGMVGYALARGFAILLGPPLVLPGLALLLVAGLVLAYLFSPIVPDGDVIWRWGLWLRAQLGPWLGWHLPANMPPLSTSKSKGRNLVGRARAWLSRRRRTTPSQEEARVLPQVEVQTGYALPPLNLLEMDDLTTTDTADIQKRARVIRETLAGFGIPVRVVEINQGPAVTQYCVQPLAVKKGGKKRRVSVRRILAVQNDLALILAAAPIRIEAPVPGKPYVGIEVPNPEIRIVRLGGVIASDAFQRLRSPLALALGRDVTGNPIVSDLAKLPHLLIAGATGSGKSVAISSMIVTWLMRNTPYDLRLILVDPKRVELTAFAGVPHLIGRVITDVEDVLRALTWVVLQMDDRYRLFARARARTLAGYNMWARRHHQPTLPYLVVVIDELADLMLVAKDQVEQMLTRLAQMARATGIHLVVATQRPSVDVITGLIKANFPARLAFAVTSNTDSRVVLDMPGAESLLGRGDALFLPPDRPAPVRLQGSFVSDEEIDRVVTWWREHWTEEEKPTESPWASISLDEEENLLEQAMEIVRREERVSASLLQRKLRIGFKRAQELIEELEARGVVGPDEGGGRGRRVLMGNGRDR